MPGGDGNLVGAASSGAFPAVRPPRGRRRPLYDLQARRKTVSVSLNADLVEKARAAGINISHTAEAALAGVA